MAQHSKRVGDELRKDPRVLEALDGMRKFGGLVIFSICVLSCPQRASGRTPLSSSSLNPGNADRGKLIDPRGSSAQDKTAYVALVDAGSSGSRVHVWRYRDVGTEMHVESIDRAIPEFMLPSFKKKVTPGLSSFHDDPSGAGASLKPLIDFAKDHIPQPLWASTPFIVAGTAGLRLLPISQRDEILHACEDFLLAHSPFRIRRENLRVISGAEEGIFGWVSVNYLAGRLPGMPNAHAGFLSTLEMGGASAQVTFPLSSPSPPPHLPPFHSLRVGSDRIQLYTHSYLGLGLDEARSALSSSLFTSAAPNPCIPQPGRPPPQHGAKSPRSVPEHSVGFAQCLGEVRKVLRGSEAVACMDPPCALRGVHQPPFWTEGFGRALVAFEHFRHTAAALGLLGDRVSEGGKEEEGRSAGLGIEATQARMRVGGLKAAAEDVCGTRLDGLVTKFPKMRGGQEGEYCFRATFLWAFAAEGLGLPDDTELTALLDLHGVDIDWALGLLILDVAHAARIEPQPSLAHGPPSTSTADQDAAALSAMTWHDRAEISWTVTCLVCLVCVLVLLRLMAWAFRLVRGLPVGGGVNGEAGTPSKLARSPSFLGLVDATPQWTATTGKWSMVGPVLRLINLNAEVPLSAGPIDSEPSVAVGAVAPRRANLNRPGGGIMDQSGSAAQADATQPGPGRKSGQVPSPFPGRSEARLRPSVSAESLHVALPAEE